MSNPTPVIVTSAVATIPLADVKSAHAITLSPKPDDKITLIYDAKEDKAIPFDFDNNLIYSDAVKDEVPSAPDAPKNQTPLFYFRINLGVKHPDGSIGPLLIETDDCYSFGVSENRNRQTNALDGYSMSLAMWNREGPTPKQKATTDFLEELVAHNKKHIVKVRDSIEQYRLEEAVLWKYKAQYWKEEKGQRIPNKGPTCYPKMIVSKKHGMRIVTPVFHPDFKDKDGNQIELDPLQLIGANGIASALIAVESIFIGANGTIISLQIKLREADFRPVDTGVKRVRQVSSTAVVLNGDDNPIAALLKVKGKHNDRAPAQQPLALMPPSNNQDQYQQQQQYPAIMPPSAQQQYPGQYQQQYPAIMPPSAQQQYPSQQQYPPSSYSSSSSSSISSLPPTQQPPTQPIGAGSRRIIRSSGGPPS